MSGLDSSVERFFSEQLPAVIAVQAEAFRRTQGILSIIVEGAGSWTVTFGDPTSPAVIVDEADTEADCIAVWTVTSFSALLAGEKDLARIRPVAVVGEEKLLARLGALMMVPQQKGGLGARLAHLAA